MKQGFQMSDPAKKLLTDSENDINGCIARCDKFSTTQSGATVKYRVATVRQTLDKAVKELNKILMEAKL
jgi:predicted enzyme related to lactoylglutathione lyase